MPSGRKRADDLSLKEYRGKKGGAQETGSAAISRAFLGKSAGESHQQTASEYFSTASKAGNFSDNGYAQSFSGKREEQIYGYKKRKFFGSGKEKYSSLKAGRENAGKEGTDRENVCKENTGREYTDRRTNAATGKSTTSANFPESCQMEIQSLQMQSTGGAALSQMQDPLSVEDTSASRIRKRNAGDSIRWRSGDIPGRRGKSRVRDKKSKRDNRNKNAKKDSFRSDRKNRKDRAAAFRLLAYASDKLSQEEEKDSLLKVAKDLLTGRIKTAAAGKLLSTGASLLPVLLPVFMVAVIITLLFNSPFSILLPKLSEEPGVVEVLAEYTEDFRERVQGELVDPGSGDETELVYVDYEGDGKPDNMADILMVYMVKHGFGDTAGVMTEKNRRALKDIFDEMTSLDIAYCMEIIEQTYEEEDFYGNINVRTEEAEVRIKEVRITLLTSEDIIRTGIFTEEETEILRYLMSPEILGNIEGLTGGYGGGSPGAGSLTMTPEEVGRLDLGGDTGSKAVKNALAKLGKPYSQAKRDSGDHYDCSSLTYYAYKEAGITLSYHGSNTAASQGKLLSDRGCEIDYEDIQPGDLIFYSFTRNGRYKNISHVAVYVGNGYLVDASSSKGCVVFRPVYSKIGRAHV